MNQIWSDNLFAVVLLIVGIIIFYGLRKLFIAKHKKHGTSPTTRYDDPAAYGVMIFAFILLIIYQIVEAIVISMK